MGNLIEAIGDKVTFKVVTRDRDRDDEQPYDGVRAGDWRKVGKAEVLYLAVDDLSIWQIDALLEDSGNAPIFLNSLFSPVTRRVLVLNKFARRSRVVVLAPRGECAASALENKKTRKAIFLEIAGFLGLYDQLVWLSSSPHESDDIRAVLARLGTGGTVREIPELPTNLSHEVNPASTKQAGTLNAAFLGRIVPVKNLMGALHLLKGVSGNINFTVHGPKEDLAYWNLCEKEIQDLPDNVRVSYAGTISHEHVPDMLAKQHLLIAPSFGENYGHSIVEALSVGCPVLTSDQTPWRGLTAAGAGWDLEVADATGARQAIETLVGMNSVDFALMRKRTIAYAAERIDYEGIAYRSLDFFTTL